MNPRPAALLLLPTLACAVGPNYTKPQIPVPKTWTEAMPKAANAESLARWWTEFQDPTLDRLVKEAVEGNLDLKIAAARIREARAARGIAASAGRPQVGANAAYARTQRSEGVFEAGFDASWEIDVFGGVRRDKEAALADVQAAEEGRREDPGHPPGRRRPQLPRAARNPATAPHPRRDPGLAARHPRPRESALRSRPRHRARRRTRRRPPESQRSRAPHPGAPDKRGDLPPRRSPRKRAQRPRERARDPSGHPAHPPRDPHDTPLRAPLQAPGPEASRT